MLYNFLLYQLNVNGTRINQLNTYRNLIKNLPQILKAFKQHYQQYLDTNDKYYTHIGSTYIRESFDAVPPVTLETLKLANSCFNSSSCFNKDSLSLRRRSEHLTFVCENTRIVY